MSAILQAFEEAVSELAAGAGAAEARLVSVACVAASAALLHVRSIAAMYKTPSRPGPSHYVANLLRSAEVCPTSSADGCSLDCVRHRA